MIPAFIHRDGNGPLRSGRKNGCGNLVARRAWLDTGRFLTRLGILVLAGCVGMVEGADVIHPTGAGYVSVSASSEFNESYTAANLFNYNVSGATVGASLADGREWALGGPPVTNGYVAFDLGDTCLVSSLYYAQRNSGNPPTDMLDLVQIWTSESSAFDPNTPPVTSPAAVISITNYSSRVWVEYLLDDAVLGRYFLLNFVQTNGAGYAPGAGEMRLGGSFPDAVPPFFTQMPSNTSRYIGGTAGFSVAASDGNTAPMFYQWKREGASLVDDARISGSAAPTLKIVNLNSGDAGEYSCTVTNIAGSTDSAVAILSIVPEPSTAFGATIMANHPHAFWRFDEAFGAAVAFDFVGGFDAAYGLSSSPGTPGPQSPTFAGFTTTNTALGIMLGDPNSVVTVPALNLDTNTVTIIAWINPELVQDPYSSLIVWRDGSGTGYGLLAYGGKLAWIWSNIGWYDDSGLVIPQKQWSMAAMVVTSTNTTLYLGANGSLNSYVSSNANGPAAFDTSTFIGCDSGTRVFNGSIDDVAFFAHPLSASDVAAIYEAGLGQVPSPEVLSWSVSGSNLMLIWSGPWTLMQADDVNGPWHPAPEISSGSLIPISAGKKFFRLQH